MRCCLPPLLIGAATAMLMLLLMIDITIAAFSPIYHAAAAFASFSDTALLPLIAATISFRRHYAIRY